MGATDDDMKLLDLYRELRVADVRDGMDWSSMHHFGSLSPDQYQWRDDIVEGDFIVIDQSGVDAGLEPDETVR
jgi:hypothetical protein